MDSPAVEVIGTMSNGSCVLRIENGLAYRIYKTSTPRIKAIFDGSRPAVENKTLVIVPENLIEDFSEAFAAEFQNVHGVPINLKFAYDTRTAVDAGGFDTQGLHATIIQELGSEELISFKVGNLFSYAWNVTIHLNFVSEFATTKLVPLQKVVVDLYNTNGVPLVSMDMAGQPLLVEHPAIDSTTVTVPEKPLYSRDV